MIIPKRAICVQLNGLVETNKLAESVNKLAFRECKETDEESWGFFGVDEFNESSERVMQLMSFIVVSIRRDHKKLNKTRLSRAWRADIAKKEKADNIRLDKAKRDELREIAKTRLLRETIPSETYIKLVIENDKNRVYVLTSSAGDAEYAIEKLNLALGPQGVAGSFSADAMEPVLEETLTQWLATPEAAKEKGYEIGDDMRLKDEKSSTATLKHHEADSAEVREHLHAGKGADKVQLIVEQSSVTFCVSATKILSKIDLKPICAEKIKSERENNADAASAKQAEAIIWLTELSNLFDQIEMIPE